MNWADRGDGGQRVLIESGKKKEGEWKAGLQVEWGVIHDDESAEGRPQREDEGI